MTLIKGNMFCIAPEVNGAFQNSLGSLLTVVALKQNTCRANGSDCELGTKEDCSVTFTYFIYKVNF